MAPSVGSSGRTKCKGEPFGVIDPPKCWRSRTGKKGGEELKMVDRSIVSYLSTIKHLGYTKATLASSGNELSTVGKLIFAR